jgi:hypothetical protein
MPTKNFGNRGSKLSWEEKKKKSEEMKSLKNEIRVMKEKKIEKRREMKELRKIKNKQKEYNEIKSGKFEVIKNPKNIKKWSKKMKQQLIKLPAEVFESIIRK